MVLPDDLYGGTYRLIDKVLAPWGLRYDMVDQTDLDALERAVGSQTRLIWVESPTNPSLDVIDIAAVVARRGRRWLRSTTRSPPRPTSVRSSSAPTPSCTRRPSTWAATPTWSAAR